MSCAPPEASLLVWVVLVVGEAEIMTRSSAPWRAEWRQVFKVQWRLFPHSTHPEWRLSFHFQTRRHESFIIAKCAVWFHMRSCNTWHFQNIYRWRKLFSYSISYLSAGFAQKEGYSMTILFRHIFGQPDNPERLVGHYTLHSIIAWRNQNHGARSWQQISPNLGGTMRSRDWLEHHLHFL